MTTHNSGNEGEKIPQLQTHEQQILAKLDELLRSNVGMSKRFEPLRKGRRLNQFQALLQRHGLLQTTLFLLRKYKEKNQESQQRPDESPAIEALELVSTVLQRLEANDNGGDTCGLFRPADKAKTVYYMDPSALARLDLITYQRLQLDALTISGLASRLVESLEALEDMSLTLGTSGENPVGGKK